MACTAFLDLNCKSSERQAIGVLKRIVQASSNPSSLVLDFFAGSGTTGAACSALGRQFVLIDDNLEAMEVMARRFKDVMDIEWIGDAPHPFQNQPKQSSLFDSLVDSPELTLTEVAE